MINYCWTVSMTLLDASLIEFKNELPLKRLAVLPIQLLDALPDALFIRASEELMLLALLVPRGWNVCEVGLAWLLMSDSVFWRNLKLSTRFIDFVCAMFSKWYNTSFMLGRFDGSVFSMHPISNRNYSI